MTKAEFLKSLDFENAKATIARKLSIKPETLTVKVMKNGVFEIDIKGANGATGALVNGAKKAVLAVTRTDIGEATDLDGKPTGVFAYNADINIIIKNGDQEFNAKVGELDFVKNKLIFSTCKEIAEQEKLAKAKQKADREAAKKTTNKKSTKATPAKAFDKKTTPAKKAPAKKTAKAPAVKPANPSIVESTPDPSIKDKN